MHRDGAARTLELRVSLDAPLPSEVGVGAGTALFVCGTCYCPQAPLRSLELLVDGAAVPVCAHSMPRLDHFAALHPQLDPYATGELQADPASAEDPLLLSYRSGFWGLATIPPRGVDGDCELALRGWLDDGRAVEAALAHLRALAARGPGGDGTGAAPGGSDGPAGAPGGGVPDGAGGAPGDAGVADRSPQVAICMATYEPPAELFERQVESIRAQRHRDWICYVSDDCSSAPALELIRRTLGEDPRFVLSRSARRLGFYRNFERALAMVPAGVRFVALADQDDSWHPDKLEILLGSIGDAQLIYSDARIVARDGRLISDTYWSARRNNHTDLASLLMANSVTGAASLFRRELLDHALPFPPAQFAHFHDHWLALNALALGRIEFVERPLYDYVQHDDAWLGHATANRIRSLRDRVGGLRTRGPRDRVRKWRMHYFVDIGRLMQLATVLELRLDGRIAPRKRRTLRRFARGRPSLAMLRRLLLGGVRELVGRPETLGAEWMLLFALLWRAALEATARPRPQRRLRLDAVPPPDLAPAPERVDAAGTPLRASAGAPLRASARPLTLTAGALAPARAIAAKVAPLALEVSHREPRRINLLIPTIDLEHVFGGYIAKFNLARRLAERGHRVRVLTVDPTGPLPRGWKRRLEAYSGLARLTDSVEIQFGRESPTVPVSAADGFIATTWWTAHIANAAVAELGARRFVYLIQEYEPFTFPMGTYAALAAVSYGFPHFALFSSELLRGYFRAHALGVYGAGPDSGEAHSASFENAITPVLAPSAGELAARRVRGLLFYARPDAHAARNLFELGMLALERAVAEGCFDAGWELRGIGSVAQGGRLALGNGVWLELVKRASQREYARLLARHDVGLALMYTPHPSLVPIEMASAGMLTVTNSFENKTAEALEGISENLIAPEPTVEAIAAALARAVAATGDVERRVRGSRVRWSRDWDRSFDDALLDRVAGALE